jgi:hypothetical protein
MKTKHYDRPQKVFIVPSLKADPRAAGCLAELLRDQKVEVQIAVPKGANERPNRDALMWCDAVIVIPALSASKRWNSIMIGKGIHSFTDHFVKSYDVEVEPTYGESCEEEYRDPTDDVGRNVPVFCPPACYDYSQRELPPFQRVREYRRAKNRVALGARTDYQNYAAVVFDDEDWDPFDIAEQYEVEEDDDEDDVKHYLAMMQPEGVKKVRESIKAQRDKVMDAKRKHGEAKRGRKAAAPQPTPEQPDRRRLLLLIR